MLGGDFRGGIFCNSAADSIRFGQHIINTGLSQHIGAKYTGQTAAYDQDFCFISLFKVSNFNGVVGVAPYRYWFFASILFHIVPAFPEN